MDNNTTNNQDSTNVGTNGTVSFFEGKRLALVTLTCFLVVVFVVVYFYADKVKKDAYQKMLVLEKSATVVKYPIRTNYTKKDEIPSEFPTSTPLHGKTSLSQSYMLDYNTGKQTTVVFSSSKSAAENYSFYESFIKRDSWKILNSRSTTTVKFLYAIKGNSNINVTISMPSSTSTDSIVSVSYLLAN
jgi:hypothetical protein